MSMFNGKLKTDQPAEYISSNGNGSSMGNSSTSSVIAAGTVIKGDITSNADIRIEGTLTGNVVCSAKIIIGAAGQIDGDISGQQADIIGKINGTIKVKDLLQLKGASVVEGNIYAGKLQVEPSATFNGECHMVSMATTEITPMLNDSFIAE